MYLEIPEDAAGTFWQATNMAQYTLQFVNISNLLWYANKTAKPAKGTAAVIEQKVVTAAPMLYPNPSTGVFNCMQSGSTAKVDEIIIYNTQGAQVSSFKNATAVQYLFSCCWYICLPHGGVTGRFLKVNWLNCRISSKTIITTNFITFAAQSQAPCLTNSF